MIESKDIRRCAKLLSDADHVLIGAGSGLTAAAGIDYMDRSDFARHFPGLVKLGFRMRAQLIGYTGWSEELKWGYLAMHVNQVRFQAPSHPVYGRLLEMVRGKDTFVITSNVDGMFVKNGFEKDRIFTPQGDYALLQCEKPCSNETWPIRPVIDRILPTIDPSTQEVTDPKVIPRCPNCGGTVFMNVHGGYWFLEDPYTGQAERFTEWAGQTRGSRLLAMEIGAGFNTPGLIRWPFERIVYGNSGAHLVRVNLQQADVPIEIAKRSVSLQCDAMEAVTALWKAMASE